MKKFILDQNESWVCETNSIASISRSSSLKSPTSTNNGLGKKKKKKELIRK